MLKSLYQIQQDIEQKNPNYLDTVDLLESSYRVFDEAIDSMTFGAEMIGQGQNQDRLFTNPTYREATGGLLDETQQIWQEYRRHIDPVASSYYPIYINETMTEAELLLLTQTAIAYGAEVNESFLQLLQQIAETTEQIAQDKALRLRTIQMIGMVLVLTNFFIILFHFIRRLRSSDQKAERAQKETSEILDNVTEGLFLIDKDMKLGSQTSASLQKMLRREDFAGDDLLELMRPLLSESNLALMRDYLEILMQPHVRIHLVRDLNPLQEIEIVFDNQDGSLSTHYLSFSFSRVNDANGHFLHLLAMVQDVTEKVVLRSDLSRAEKKAKQEIEVLLSILHVEPSLISEFMATSRRDLQRINAVLKAPERNADALRDKFLDIARLAHKIKGDCAAVGLKAYAERLHGFEDIMQPLQNKVDLSGIDFIPVAVFLNELLQEWDLLQTIYQRLQGLNLQALPEGQEPDDLGRENAWKKVVEESAKDCHKNVVLDLSRFQWQRVPEPHIENIDTFVKQALRNAVVHGVESPSIREQQNKPKVAKIQVYNYMTEDFLVLGVRDDGAGLNLPKIRYRAEQLQCWDSELAKTDMKSMFIELIFSPGFSTAKEVNEHAGRGMGLDLIKQRIEAAGGRIDVGSKSRQFTDFRVQLPHGSVTMPVLQEKLA